MFRELYRSFLSKIDTGRLYENTESLYRLEYGQTFSCYHKSAQRVVEILQNADIPNIEKISFPADGKTAYQDKIMPLGWEASSGKLTIVSGFEIPENFAAADYQKHPFHLIKGSCGTAPGGERVRIISEEQLLSGCDPHDALVLIPEGIGPFFSDFISRSLDLGVRGFVSDFAMNGEEAPDKLQWNNAFTERANWHVTCDDREFIAFCVTPETGKLLRKAVSRGEVLAEIESDARRFKSHVDLITALIPGQSDKEFWITAHLYEPLSNDNSSGIAAAIETARLLMAQGEQKFSLRLIFAMEYYGFAAYAATRRHNAIGGCDYDAMYLRKDWKINFRCAAPATPFYGNYLAKIFADELNGEPEVPEINYLSSFECMYDDDTFLADPTIGIPMVWPIRDGKNYMWHNSAQTMDYIHKEEFARGVALHTAYVSSVVNPGRDILPKVQASALKQLKEEPARSVGSAQEHFQVRYEILLQDLKDFEHVFDPEDIEPAVNALTEEFEALQGGLDNEIPRSKWRDYISGIIPHRIKSGFPHDLADVPPSERAPLPGSVLYSPLAAILANMNGKRNLAEIIRRTEHEICRLIPEKELQKLVRSLFYLARYGYISLGDFAGITREEIVKSLRQCGVKAGDCLVVHSALGGLGLNSAVTVIEALKEAVGENGVFLLPSFTYPFVFLGEPNRSPLYRPFDPENLKNIWTGTLPRTLLEKYPEAVRSKHITHSWCGLGAKAQELCGAHLFNDPPMGERSPLEFARQKGAKIVFIGCTVTDTTFLHLLEDRLDLPGIETALCKVKKPNGYCECVAVPKNLPGDRDFYSGTEESIRFFRAAREAGLEIRHATLGLGEVSCIDMTELYRIGMKLLQKEPNLLLSMPSNPRTLCDLSCVRLFKNKEK